MRLHNISFLNIKNKQCILNDKTLGNLILQNRIGSKSKYGHVYKMKTNDNKYEVAVKIMDDSKESKKEISILKKIQKKKNLHFPFIYKFAFCNINSTNDFWFHSSRPVSTSSSSIHSLSPISNYNIIINELANYDLKTFIQKKHTNKIILNAFIQVMISILSFHNIGYKHLDTHWGNFLHHTIEKEGYIEYIIDGKKYYLENLGFVFTIWDFGLSKKIDEYPSNDYSFHKQLRKSKDFDYIRILNAFIPENSNGWNPNIKKIKKIIDFYNFAKLIVNDPRKSYEKKLFEYLFDNNFFLNKPESSKIYSSITLKFT
jgi:hypothetical protein